MKSDEGKQTQRAVLIFCAVAALFESATLVEAGQTPAPAPSPTKAAPVDNSRSLLCDRNRALMHPGDPLVLIGLEQGENDPRARTPALAQSDRAPVQVNQDESYRRALAMYDDAAVFHAPLPTATPEEAEAKSAAPQSHRAPQHSEAPTALWPWILAAVFAGSGGLWFAMRRSVPEPVLAAGRPKPTKRSRAA